MNLIYTSLTLCCTIIRVEQFMCVLCYMERVYGIFLFALEYYSIYVCDGINVVFVVYDIDCTCGEVSVFGKWVERNV